MTSKMSGITKKLHYTIGLVAVFGIVDASILTYQHYANSRLPCSVTRGCEVVLNSKYSVIAGVPLAALGVAFYLSVLTATIISLKSNKAWLKDLLLLMGFSGFLTSLGLVYIQGFIIRAWCQYCLFSALSSTLIFALSLALAMSGQSDNKQLNKESE